MRRHGAALIEEFIEGTECTVLVAENPEDPPHPKTYTPIQYRFPEGETFKHADMKWVDYDRMSAFPVGDPDLDARLRDVSARFFVALEGASFGRCDLRVDRSGTPFMLEINPELRRVLPVHGSRERRPVPRARSGRSCRVYAPADPGGIATTPCTRPAFERRVNQPHRGGPGFRHHQGTRFSRRFAVALTSYNRVPFCMPARSAVSL